MQLLCQQILVPEKKKFLHLHMGHSCKGQFTHTHSFVEVDGFDSTEKDLAAQQGAEGQRPGSRQAEPNARGHHLQCHHQRIGESGRLATSSLPRCDVQMCILRASVRAVVPKDSKYRGLMMHVLSAGPGFAEIA